MNNSLQEKQLLFAINRAKACGGLSKENFPKTVNGIAGSKLKQEREDYAYECNMVKLAADKKLLKKDVKITPKRLSKAFKELAEENKLVNDEALSI